MTEFYNSQRITSIRMLEKSKKQFHRQTPRICKYIQDIDIIKTIIIYI